MKTLSILLLLTMLSACGEADRPEADNDETKGIALADLFAAPANRCLENTWNWSKVTTPQRQCYFGFWCVDVQVPVTCDSCTITEATGLTGRNHNPDAGFLAKSGTMHSCTDENGTTYQACFISDTEIARQIGESVKNNENRDCNWLHAQSYGEAKHSHMTSGERYWHGGQLVVDTVAWLERVR